MAEDQAKAMEMTRRLSQKFTDNEAYIDPYPGIRPGSGTHERQAGERILILPHVYLEK